MLCGRRERFGVHVCNDNASGISALHFSAKRNVFLASAEKLRRIRLTC
jgi:hypothetical protein